jgi:hypothetical protein
MMPEHDTETIMREPSMPRRPPPTPKYPTSFHQEVDVKEYLDELIDETGYYRSELINQIIREHRNQRKVKKSEAQIGLMPHELSKS